MKIHIPTNPKNLGYFAVREAETKAMRDIYIEDGRTRGDEAKRGKKYLTKLDRDIDIRWQRIIDEMSETVPA